MTLATIGYGDILVFTDLGRMCIVVFILIMLFLIPKQTNELIRLMGLQSPYARRKF